MGGLNSFDESEEDTPLSPNSISSSKSQKKRKRADSRHSTRSNTSPKRSKRSKKKRNKKRSSKTAKKPSIHFLSESDDSDEEIADDVFSATSSVSNLSTKSTKSPNAGNSFEFPWSHWNIDALSQDDTDDDDRHSGHSRRRSSFGSIRELRPSPISVSPGYSRSPSDNDVGRGIILSYGAIAGTKKRNPLQKHRDRNSAGVPENKHKLKARIPKKRGSRTPGTDSMEKDKQRNDTTLARLDITSKSVKNGKKSSPKRRKHFRKRSQSVQLGGPPSLHRRKSSIPTVNDMKKSKKAKQLVAKEQKRDLGMFFMSVNWCSLQFCQFDFCSQRHCLWIRRRGSRARKSRYSSLVSCPYALFHS